MLNRINRKTIISVLIPSVLLAVIFSLFLKEMNLKPKPAVSPKPSFSEVMTGNITRVDSGSIVVTGVINTSEIQHQENKTVEFKINPQTVFSKTVTVVDKVTKNPIRTYSTKGSVSGLVVGLAPVEVRSRENLFVTDKATAISVHYFVLETGK